MKTATKDEILNVGTEMIATQGFNTTGLDQVLKKARVPKGSFYHYFKSKEEFGLAVIEKAEAELLSGLDKFLTDSKVSPLERVKGYLNAGTSAKECDEERKKGCIIGMLGQEMASQSEIFRKRIGVVFETWKAKIASCLDEAKQAGEISKDNNSDQLAECLLSGWEGAMLRAKVEGSCKPLRDFRDVYFNKVLR